MKRRATKSGFTLIELLAVIVILAIIALIAVPIILNIIDKANKSAFKDTAYGIISAGELYFAEQQLEVNGMTESKTFNLPDTTNTLGLKGNVPEGYITITRGGDIELKVKNDRYCVTKGFSDTDVTITDNPTNCEIPSGEGNQGETGEKTLTDLMVSTTNNCVTSGQCTPEQISTDEGIKVTINVKENTPKDFYVLADDGSKVTLIMSENLGDNVEWINASEYSTENTDGTSCRYTACNDEGPVTALNTLNARTNYWEIPEFTYVLSGLAQDGATQRYPDSQVTSKARLITYAEAQAVGCTTSSGSCPDWMYKNLKGTGSDKDSLGNYRYGYWTSKANASDTGSAWNVYYSGGLTNDGTDFTNYGIRPVIELSK